MKRMALTVLAAFAVVLLGGSRAHAFDAGTYTITGQNTCFDITVSAPDASGNQTVTVNGGGKMWATAIRSVTPNSFTTHQRKQFLGLEFTVETVDGEKYNVELHPGTDEVTDGDATDDHVGAFTIVGGSGRSHALKA